MYAPLVSQKNAMHCALNVLLLKSEAPDALLNNRGDIDNRLKTLFDALRVPSKSHMPKIAAETSKDENPLYCLLQDDSLVTDLRIRSDRLLTTDVRNSVFAIVTVRLLGSPLTMANIDLIGT